MAYTAQCPTTVCKGCLVCVADSSRVIIQRKPEPVTAALANGVSAAPTVITAADRTVYTVVLKIASGGIVAVALDKYLNSPAPFSRRCVHQPRAQHLPCITSSRSGCFHVRIQTSGL